MFHEDIAGARAGGFREAFAVWRATAPLREQAGKIDWAKVIAQLEKILPLVLAVLDLLPKKPADRVAGP